VFSVIWFFGATYEQYQEAIKSDDITASLIYGQCIDRRENLRSESIKICKSEHPDYPQDELAVGLNSWCTTKYPTQFKKFEDMCSNESVGVRSNQESNRHLSTYLINAFVPIPIFWLLVFILIKIYRWIMKGQP
jgi:hypothetical protein